MEPENVLETDLTVGPRAIGAYSRLSYTMWHAFAEFIDNSTQSLSNYGEIIKDVLLHEGTPLEVKIAHNRVSREITIEDNSIGMTKDDLIEALRVAHPTADSRGRSKYGMGMKTAACWIGRRWQVVTCEWSSGEEWTADVDVDGIVTAGKKIPLTVRQVDRTLHYTRIIISNLHRNIQKRTEETIRGYLGSMYQFDLLEGSLKLLYNGEEVMAPAQYEFDTDPEGKMMRREIPPTQIDNKTVTGWVGVLRKGGRKYGGFSLFQNRRQIQGFPQAWKPKIIFGGVDDEGANNLISQRLTGVIELDGFEVSHTKDAVLFEGDEEEKLEDMLAKITKDYRDYAQRRRGGDRQPWSREKVRDLIDSMKKEFTSSELGDALTASMLPPIETILANNQRQLASLTAAEEIARFDVTPELRVVVSLQEKSEYEPHLTIVAGADIGTIHVIINGLHPYYSSLDSSDAIDECLRQYIYDAIAEYRASKLTSRVVPDSVRRLKNDLLRVQAVRIESYGEDLQRNEFETTIGGVGGND